MYCTIYNSPKHDLLYLFIPEANDFEEVPESLMHDFGEPQFVMSLDLEPGKKLACITADEVMANLKGKGYHLQMPPKDPWL